jgi:hypothetical protein
MTQVPAHQIGHHFGRPDEDREETRASVEQRRVATRGRWQQHLGHRNERLFRIARRAIDSAGEQSMESPDEPSLRAPARRRLAAIFLDYF